MRNFFLGFATLMFIVAVLVLGVAMDSRWQSQFQQRILGFAAAISVAFASLLVAVLVS